jgi:guanylate kinase
MESNLIEESKFITLYENEINIIENILSKLNLKPSDNNDNKKNKKNSLVFMGPSGVGKDTIINMLLKKYPEIFYKLPSYTTRKIREGEKEGVDYFFITKKEFQVMKNENKLIGIQEYNDNFYASDKSKLNELMNKGDKIIILNYNIETANKVKEEFDFNFIALLPPCEDELRNRLKNRGTKPEEMEKRMINSLKEMKLINEANYIQYRVLNDEKNICFTKVENHIKKLYPKFFKDISIIN